MASSLNITGLESIQEGILCGIYHPKSMQCGWPVYYHENNSNIRLSYFGDDHQGQWRIQNFHPSSSTTSSLATTLLSNHSSSSSSSMDLLPILKISIHGSCYPHEILLKYPTSHWLLRTDDLSHLIWSMMNKQERYEPIETIRIYGISKEVNQTT